jgi:hypothetical protein
LHASIAGGLIDPAPIDLKRLVLLNRASFVEEGFASAKLFLPPEVPAVRRRSGKIWLRRQHRIGDREEHHCPGNENAPSDERLPDCGLSLGIGALVVVKFSHTGLPHVLTISPFNKMPATPATIPIRHAMIPIIASVSIAVSTKHRLVISLPQPARSNAALPARPGADRAAVAGARSARKDREPVRQKSTAT